MSRHGIHVSFSLLVCILILSVNSISASTPSIAVFPLSDDMRDLPIRVYWVDGACTPSQREVIKDGVNIALGILAGGASMLAREYPDGFAGFESFMFVMASTEKSAQIIITDANIDRSGRTILRILGDKIIPPARIELACELASMGLDAVITVALHELGHALGLGHTDFEEHNGVKELMYPVLRQFTYPSTLDLYAIYLLVIKGYSGSSISLPEWFPYAQFSPHSLIYPEAEGGEVSQKEAAMLTELERRINELSDRLSSLEKKILSLGDDIQMIEKRISELEEKVGSLESSTLELRRLADETGEILAACVQALSHLNESISHLASMMTGQSEHFERKIAELAADMEKLRISLSEASARWSENIRAIMEHHDALEKRLGVQEEQGKMLYKESRRMSSKMEMLELKIAELEESLEKRDQQLARLQEINAILSVMLAAALAIAITSLIRASRARAARNQRPHENMHTPN